ncbi:MAG TPA: PAS domain S-box protein [Candidatus Mcinerneyibacterium sp.]|nr:PAS domain S-box protein [Candidatus Mcinerneyibacterium sp.]
MAEDETKNNLIFQELNEFRKNILDLIIIIIAVIGIPIIFFEFKQGMDENIFLIPFIYSIFEAILILIAVFRNKITFLIKKVLTIVLLLFISSISLVNNGLSGGGQVLFVIFIILASLLLEKKWLRISIIAVLLIFSAVGFGMVTGYIPIKEKEMLTSINIESWLMALGILTIISFSFIISTLKFRNKLVKLIKKIRIQNKKLEDEILKHKNAKKELRESKKRLSRLIENVPGMTYRCLNEKKYTMKFLSKGVEELTGYRVNEVLNNNKIAYGEIIHSEDRDYVWKNVKEGLKNQEQFEMRYRIVTRSGKIKWVWERGRGVSDKNKKVEILEGIISDISDKKRAEKELEKERDFIKLIMETTPAAIVNVDKKGKIIYANETAEDLFELTRDDITQYYYNDPKWNMSDFDGNPYPEEKLPFNIVKRTLKPVNDVRHAIRHKGEKRKYLSISAAPVLDENGKFDGIVAIVLDLTEKVKNQKEREKLRKENIRLQKMDAIGTLAGGIAHDFNNLLFAMMGNIELALSKSKSREKRLEFLKNAQKSGEKAKALIKQILTFSRQQDYEKDIINIVPVTKETLKLINTVIPSNIKLKTEITDKDLYMNCNPSHVSQIIMNVGTNAYHSMEENGGELLVKLEKIKREESGNTTLDKEKYALITIEDTGKGIKEEEIDKIFMPYYTTKDIEKGTGLGLSTVDGIVKNLYGKMEVESEVGKGTIFKIYLPLSNEKKENENKDKMKIKVKDYNLVYVDDEEALTEIFSEKLPEFGCSVKTFNNPKKAKDYILKNYKNYDAFIFDQTMPDLTGEDLTRIIRKEAIDVPIFILTGYSKVFDEEKAEKIGVNGYFYKPVNFEKLYQDIYRKLEKK